MSAEVFLDTNVLVYAYDQSEPAKQARARQLIKSVSPVVSTQVLGEFHVAVTRKLRQPLACDVAAAVVRDVTLEHVVSLDAALVNAAVATSIRYQLSYWDSLIIEAAVRAGCSQLYSEDLSDGAEYHGVTVRNPFADQGTR